MGTKWEQALSHAVKNIVDFFFVAGHHVWAGVERLLDVGVTETLGDGDDGNTFGNEQGSVGIAKIMQVEMLPSAIFCCLDKTKKYPANRMFAG